MNYGKAEGLKVKLIQDYTDGNAEEKLNRFFEENPKVEIIDVKMSYQPSEHYNYGHEYAMVFYRELN